MTNEQALANLDGAVATIHTDRQSHGGLVMSVKVLQTALAELAALKAKHDDGKHKPDS